MNSTKLWFSSNIGDREHFYNLLYNSNGVSRSKLHQTGMRFHQNFGASPHYYIDNMKELHGLCALLNELKNLIKLKVCG